MPLGEPTPIRVATFSCREFIGYRMADGWPIDHGLDLPDGIEFWLARTTPSLTWTGRYALVELSSGCTVSENYLGRISDDPELAMERAKKELALLTPRMLEGLPQSVASRILSQRLWCIVSPAEGLWEPMLLDDALSAGLTVEYGPYPSEWNARHDVNELRRLLAKRYTGATDLILEG